MIVLLDFLLQESDFLLGEELDLQSPPPPGKGPAPSRGVQVAEELDLSFLPDELSSRDEQSRHDNTGTTSTEDVHVLVTG